MISRFGILQKRDDMSTEDFNKHWHDVHAPIVTQMKGIRHYRQNLVTNTSQLGIGFATRSPLEADGFSELCYDSISDMQEGMASQASAAQADLPKFIKDSKMVVALKRKVVPVPTHFERPLIKRITFLKRKPEFSAEDFVWEWLGLHADMVKYMPHVVGYHQNVIIDRIVGGKSVSYDELPYDGIVEFWFESVEDLEKCFASSAYTYTGTHGKVFLDTMTTFLVEETPIIR